MTLVATGVGSGTDDAGIRKRRALGILSASSHANGNEESDQKDLESNKKARRSMPATMLSTDQPPVKKVSRRVSSVIPQRKLSLVHSESRPTPVFTEMGGSGGPIKFANAEPKFESDWMEKQERSFALWINYIVTDNGAEISGEGGGDPKRSSCTPWAVRETDRVRRKVGKELLSSNDMQRTLNRIEKEIKESRLVARCDRSIAHDVGLRDQVLGGIKTGFFPTFLLQLVKFILNFNSCWLRMGLEVLFNESIPRLHGQKSDDAALRRFLKARLFVDREFVPDAKRCHFTLPHKK